MADLNKLVDELSALTITEAAELAKTLKEKLGLPDAVAMAAPVAAAAVAAVEEKTEFDVILEGVPADKKINILKEVRAITGLGLGEAKTVVESTPAKIKEGISKQEAEDIKKKLEAAGASCKVQ